MEHNSIDLEGKKNHNEWMKPVWSKRGETSVRRRGKKTDGESREGVEARRDRSKRDTCNGGELTYFFQMDAHKNKPASPMRRNTKLRPNEDAAD